MTLVQTGKVTSFPIILVGTEFWSGMLDWFRSTLLPAGVVSEKDLALIQVTDDPKEAARLAAVIDDGA